MVFQSVRLMVVFFSSFTYTSFNFSCSQSVKSSLFAFYAVIILVNLILGFKQCQNVNFKTRF